jgi:deoxyribonucleoside regulator
MLRKLILKDNIRLLTKVALLYYKSHLSQAEIANRLGVSRQMVGRLLQRAADQGVVRIDIHSPLSYASELELQLEEIFGLSEVIVVTSPLESDDAVNSAIGEAAADFLQRRVKDGDILGIVSGSTALYQCATHLRAAHVANVTIVSLTGSSPRSPVPPHGETILHSFGKAFGAKTVSLHAPAFVDRPDIKQSLLSDSNIASVLELGHQANIAIIGIGAISEEFSPYKHGYIDYELLQVIKKEGGVGEICGHAYDIHGSLCSPEISQRSIAIELENLRSKELTVALAGGLRKLDAIWGGLQGRYFNALITDEDTARALLARKHQAEIRYSSRDTQTH